MSRRKRHKSHASSGGTAAVADLCPAAEPVSIAGGYAGATSGPSRGQLAWGTLDTRIDFDPSDHRELMRRSRALMANSGIARVIVTIAMMVGSQQAQMDSGDSEWDEAVETLLRIENGSALICDRSGQNNLEQFQQLVELLAMRDGDCFIVLTKTDTGRASYRLYEAHVVNGQPNGSWSDKSWRNGIKFNNDGRPVSYFFQDQDNLTKGTEIPAQSVIHYKYADATSVRGVPALAHAVLNITDIIERRGFTKATIKLRAMLGLAITMDVDGKKTGDRPISGQLRMGPGAYPSSREGELATAADRGPKVEEVSMAGNTTSVMRLAPGEDAKILNDDSPNPNATEFENEILRDVAIGLQMPPQVIFWLEKQTGPMVRFTVRMAEKRIGQRRAYARNVFLNRWIAYQVATAGKAGRLPAKFPAKWFNCTWQEPASLTIDVGRDGNLELRQLDAGVSSMDDVIGPAGGNWRETVAQKRKEAAFVIDQAKELSAETGLPLDQCLSMIRQPGRAADQITKPDSGAAA